MTASPDRRAELIAAAVGDDLDDAEADELRALAASDPTVDIEIAELRATTEQLERRGPNLPWLDSTPSSRSSMRSTTCGSKVSGMARMCST